jgi:hypothetical protein
MPMRCVEWWKKAILTNPPRIRLGQEAPDDATGVFIFVLSR